jgi:hypothetical protein
MENYNKDSELGNIETPLCITFADICNSIHTKTAISEILEDNDANYLNNIMKQRLNGTITLSQFEENFLKDILKNEKLILELNKRINIISYIIKKK